MQGIPWEEGELMEKIYIYEIKNKQNNKVYVGKTNNLKNRMIAHFSTFSWDREPGKALYRAMRKYGVESFEYSVLEITDSENWESRERFWIEQKDSLRNGYNMIEGGSEPPTFHNENHPMAKLDWKKVLEIIEMLESGVSIVLIAGKFSISTDQIYRINKGTSWKVENKDYPIMTYRLNQETVDEIKMLLLTTDMSQKEIAKIYGVSRTTITAINRGQNFKVVGAIYPIRDRYRDINKAKEMLKNTTIPMIEINAMLLKNSQWASSINTGRIAYDQNEIYPLRKLNLYRL